jgi:hypothetical protein
MRSLQSRDRWEIYGSVIDGRASFNANVQSLSARCVMGETLRDLVVQLSHGGKRKARPAAQNRVNVRIGGTFAFECSIKASPPQPSKKDMERHDLFARAMRRIGKGFGDD